MKAHWTAVLAVTLAVGVVGADEGRYAGEVTASALRLRAGPTEDYQDVALLKRGERVVVTGSHNGWLMVEVPGGCDAWVYAKFLDRAGDTGTVLADRLLVRPRPTTRYHQLDGHLVRGDEVTIVGEQDSEEGLWYKIRVPNKIPLYAHADFIKKIGDESLATQAPAATEPAEAIEGAAPAAAGGSAALSEADAKFILAEPELRAKMKEAKTLEDFSPIKRTLAEIDHDSLSLDNRERRVKLLGDLVAAEREVALASLKAKEIDVQEGLDTQIKSIQEEYRKRLIEIQKEFQAKGRGPRYVASGIVAWRPDLVGRYPSYRLEEGKQMRFFLIAPDYDLTKYVGKRVGIVGITDPESGTGYHTVIAQRIEIIAHE